MGSINGPASRGAIVPERPPSQAYRAYILAMLVLVYTFNFIDRQIVGILAVPIKTELGLSDSQLGVMGGLAFALLYTTLGIPIARLADHASRTWIMTWALALWSAMSAACGLAHSFTQLFFARLGVGFGEAGGVAPAYSLICDFFPQNQRARALGVYSFGIPIGSAVGVVVGGIIASRVSWRAAFFAVGLAGLALAPLFRLTVREPARGMFDRPAARPEQSSLLEVLRVLRRKRSFWALSLGAAASSMMGYGMFFWMPSFLVRSFGLGLQQASLGFGAIVLIGGLVGIWLGAAVADRLGERRIEVYALVPAIAFAMTVPFYVAGVLSPTLWMCAALLLVPTALGLAWLGPVLSTVQHIVPPNMRVTASAIFLFIINLIGIGLGTPLIGALSDATRVRFGTESLRYAIVAGTAFYLIAAGLLLLASRSLKADWER
jgi:predicted MFS family arabinose efflux permease